MKIRPARQDDAAALGELIYIAGQSQYSSSGYDCSIGGSRATQIDELARLVAAKSPSSFHYSHFEVAESPAQIVAAAAGFDRLRCDQFLHRALTEAGWSEERIAAMEHRMAPIFRALPPELPDYWTLDHVAVLPAWRGKGLARLCLMKIIRRGEAMGLPQSKVDVFRGNSPARSLYESLGYKLRQVFDDPAFRLPLRRDPIERLMREL
jgi:GNAT superfamily N-acetyltransferase